MLDVVLAYLAGFAASLLCLALGLTLGLARLLEVERWRWFPRARWFVGLAGGLVGAGMLALEDDAGRAFWTGAVIAGLLLGRFGGVARALPAAGMAGFVGWTVATGQSFFLAEIAFVAAALMTADALRARLRDAAGRLPSWLAMATEREDWTWLLVAVAQLAIFGWDWSLLVGIWTFHSGARLMERLARSGRLASWGLRAPAES